MTLAVWFWVIYVVSLLFGLYLYWQPGQPYPYPRAGFHLVLYVLLAILGIAQFGSPVK